MLETILETYGYVALALILVLDSSGVPWPTEATLVLAGVAARAGHMSLGFAALSSLTGAAAGSALSYFLGRRMGPGLIRRVGSLFRLKPAQLDQVDAWLARYGDRAVLLGRLVPFVRCFLGFAAGAMGMPFGRYIALTLTGYTLYIALALVTGYTGLSLAHWMGGVENALWVLIPLGLLVAYLKWGRRRAEKHRGKV